MPKTESADHPAGGAHAHQGVTSGVSPAQMHVCAQPLVGLAMQLRTGVPVRPAQTLDAVVAALERFESELSQAGGDERTVVTASYLLCVWLDEAMAPHEWAAGAARQDALLMRFHGAEDGSARVFQVLDRLLEQPDQDRALLELFHVALSLGLRGRWQEAPDGASRIEAERLRIARALDLLPPLAQKLASPSGAKHDPNAKPERSITAPAGVLQAPLSPHWRPAVSLRPRDWEPRLLAGSLVAMGLISLGVYSTCNVLLARQVDEVFASLQGIESSDEAVARRPTTTAPAVRLAKSLGGLSTGLKVRDEVNRSVVEMAAVGWFDPDTAALAPDRRPEMARIAQALASQPGRVLVTAWARPDSPRPVRLPSASLLADAWAQQVVGHLQREASLPSVAAEGRIAVGDSPSRIEITLFP